MNSSDTEFKKELKTLDNEILEQQNKEELYFERECIYLDCTYSEHILNIYFNIKEYLKNRGSFLLKNMTSHDLEHLIIQHSSLYDVYYESDEDEEISDYDEYDY